jgi:hypothetical protein
MAVALAAVGSVAVAALAHQVDELLFGASAEAVKLSNQARQTFDSIRKNQLRLKVILRFLLSLQIRLMCINAHTAFVKTANVIKHNKVHSNSLGRRLYN